jgi:predicted unusual protein kinase regulating ubiquinone biosynthesis (AarF/ABC1/UbiB family)
VSDEREVPKSRLGRLARLAYAGARSGASALIAREGDAAAKVAAETLGTLRGLAAKVGQMASYVDGVVPEAQREHYEKALSALRSAAPTSSPAEIRRVVERELGAPIDRLFAEWGEQPIASASIGQVHRARLLDGREVAVKVQHPGIVDAVESDLQNAGLIEGLAQAVHGGKVDVKGMFATVRKTFREELDYRIEAERTAAFARFHRGDPKIRVPEIIADRSGRSVITSTFAAGRSFEAACAASEDERRAWAETLWRFVFRSLLIGGLFNADPHPGNYVFHDDGAVTFLDHGCVRVTEEDRRLAAVRAHVSAMSGDYDGFASAIFTLVDGKEGRVWPPIRDYVWRCYAPIVEVPFHITRPWAASLVDGVKELAALVRKAPAAEAFAFPPEMIFMNRLQFGFYSVLARLDVAVDYRAVEQAFIHDRHADLGLAIS